MPDFEIPKEDIDTLFKFAGLSSSEKASIIFIIDGYNKAEPYKTIIQEIADKTELEYDVVEDFLNIYTTLLRVKLSYSRTNEEIISNVGENIEEDEDYTADEKEQLKSWIHDLFNIPSKDFLISTLAYNLVAQSNNLYYNSAVFEELRPVFLSDNLAGLALYHTLKIHYESPGKTHSDIYFSLDDTDIDNLIEVLTKAKSRSEIIKTQYKKDLINI